MRKTYATPDVGQLSEQELAHAEFPAGRRQSFRVCFAEAVHRQIVRHASEDVSVEICGVLVGRWGRDVTGPYVEVAEFIRGDAAASKFAEVTFTHEAWSKINHEMDTRFAELNIVGWYHSHPDFGVFLSERDRFIQENFFSGPGQIAHVVDPVRQTEGVFFWKEGKPELCPHYWIGDQVYTPSESEPRERTPAEAPRSAPPDTVPPSPAAAAEGTSLLPALLRIAPYVAALLIGYLVGGMRSAWEQQMLVEGTVAHYGLWKGLRPGLDRDLQDLDVVLRDVSGSLDALDAEHLKLVDDEDGSKKEKWDATRVRLRRMRDFVDQMRAKYSLTPEEAATVQRMIAAHLAALRDARMQAESPEQTQDAKGVSDEGENARDDAPQQTGKAAERNGQQ